MKKYIVLQTALAAVLAGSVSGCIDEYDPEGSTVTADQLTNMSSGTTGLVNSIEGIFGEPNNFSSEEYDLGYLGLGMIRDIHCSDFTVYKGDYDYFWYYTTNTFLSNNYVTVYYPWAFYYKLAANTHQILRLEYSEKNKADFGLAHFFRAWAYFDLARWFEYKHTGVASLDDYAESHGIYGLTVPIIDENSTEKEARNTPRAPFYEMYKFILDDLDKAEEYLADYKRSSKNRPDVSTVYGFKARFYLELATRFRLYPDDFDTFVSSGVDLGFTTPKECYEKAAYYARRAIDISGATPLTETEWYGGNNYTDGFNSVNSNSWMLGVIIQKENLSSYTWRNFVGHMSPEQSWGVGGIDYDSETGIYNNAYKTQRIIGASLYAAIEDDDWRKNTWIDPADAPTEDNDDDEDAKEMKKEIKKAAYNSGKYKTIATLEHFLQIPAYASFKFRPKNGEMTDYSIGAAADYPLMRVEEMYFIEAEAIAGSQSVGAGVDALERFINTYRYTNGKYSCKASDMDSFIEALMIQKRIEFWGEGLVFWDYKRLELQVIKGYEGTNVPVDEYRLNSIKGYCAPWLIGYISTDEVMQNPAIKPNPDCSEAIDYWKE